MDSKNVAGMSLKGGRKDNFYFCLLEHYPEKDRWFLRSLLHVKDEEGKYKVSFGGLERYFEQVLHTINTLVAPVLNRLIPHTSMQNESRNGFKGLFLLAFSVPFILGLDDFAGYIPLFNVVNVFGFATGVFLGHMVLNIALFLSPQKTITTVKHPVISFFGSIAFVVLAVWGLYEAARLIGFGAH